MLFSMVLPALSLFDASVIIQIYRKAPGDQRWQKASDRGVENGQKILATSRNIDRKLCTQQFHLLDLLTVLPDQIGQILTPGRMNKYNSIKINNCMQFTSQKTNTHACTHARTHAHAHTWSMTSSLAVLHSTCVTAAYSGCFTPLLNGSSNSLFHQNFIQYGSAPRNNSRPCRSARAQHTADLVKCSNSQVPWCCFGDWKSTCNIKTRFNYPKDSVLGLVQTWE